MTDPTRSPDDTAEFLSAVADLCRRSTLEIGGRSLGYATIADSAHFAYVVQCLRPAGDDLKAIWSARAEGNDSAITIKTLADVLAQPVAGALMVAGTFCPFLAGMLVERGETWSIDIAARTGEWFGQCADPQEKHALSSAAVIAWWFFAAQLNELETRFPDIGLRVRLPHHVITPITHPS